METRRPIPTAHDKVLFTPGPLTTSLAVKRAMLHDAGSWHFEFNALVLRVRERLLKLAGVSRETGWESILLQGSGSFGVEAVFASAIPPEGKVVVLSNGAYGERMGVMLDRLKINHVMIRSTEDTPNDPEALDALLEQDPAITTVAVVHCETTTGVLNPIDALGAVARKYGKVYVVDAMSSFGAIPIDFERAHIDYLISSANKCIEGVPGFSFVICRRERLLATAGWARSLCLDLLDQFKGFEKNGQFRYTPPTHSILAFSEALDELDLEGGVAGRGARYQRNHTALLKGMREIGFESYLSSDVQSYIITSFHFPDSPAFTFNDFYHRLSDNGFIIYPGKLTQVNLFRIGSIGRIFEADIRQLVAAIERILKEMGVTMPAVAV